MNNTEDREVWYENAEAWEIEFIQKYGTRWGGIIINPSKELDKYAPDLYLLRDSVSADLKQLGTPFYTALTQFKIPAQHCWTVNPSDVFEYAVKYNDDFGIFVWKRFEKSSGYGVEIEEEEAVYYCPLFKLKKMMQKSKKIHHYMRRMNDTNGNSYGSHGVDLRLLHKL